MMRRDENETAGVALQWKPRGFRPIEDDTGYDVDQGSKYLVGSTN